MTRRTLLDFFADVTGDAVKDAQFLAYDDGYRTWTWTYGELGSAARQFAQRLRDNGIAAGQAIAIWSENRPEWIAAMWGALLEGIVIVPIDYRASADFLLKVVGIVDAKAILVGEAVDVSHTGSDKPIWKLAEIFRLKAEATSSTKGAASLPETDIGHRTSAATPLPRSSSRPARPRTRRVSCSRTRTSWRTLSRSSVNWRSTGSTRGRFVRSAF